MKGIDATEVFCPEFTTPVIRLIKKHLTKGELGVIKTKEERAVKRLQHICASHDWSLLGYKKQSDTYYILVQR